MSGLPDWVLMIIVVVLWDLIRAEYIVWKVNRNSAKPKMMKLNY